MFCEICRLFDSDARGELVSLASDGDDQAGVFGVVTQRLAQVGDVLLQIPFFYKRAAPDGLQQFLFGDQTVGILNQKEEDIESFRGERNGQASARQSAARRIEQKFSEAVQVAHGGLVSSSGYSEFLTFFSEFTQGLPTS